MPRVLRIINRFNLGGPTFNAAYLTKYLSADYETMLVGGVKEAHEDSSEFIVEGLGITPMELPEMQRAINYKNDKAAYRKIKEIIAEFKPDIVHTHASKPGTIGRLAAHKMKVPAIVHTFHGNVFNGYFGTAKTQVYKNIERYLAKRSHAIIAISDLQKQELVNEHKICAADKVSVVRLGFDLQRFQHNIEEKRKDFRATYHLDDNEIAIAIVGRLVPIKQHELFLKSLKHLLDKTTRKVRAFIVGDGESRAMLEALCQELGMSFGDGKSADNKTAVVFTSWIRNVDWVNAGCDIAALSSLNEGTPVSLIEAQATGRAIVSTEVGGIRNIVLPNETALLSPKTDVNAFAENMLTLVENDAMRADFAAKGWPWVREQFHYTRLCNDMGKLYSSLLR
jgi:glycosyltransferase involved in cell wall biosynthesis